MSQYLLWQIERSLARPSRRETLDAIRRKPPLILARRPPMSCARNGTRADGPRLGSIAGPLRWVNHATYGVCRVLDDDVYVVDG